MLLTFCGLLIATSASAQSRVAAAVRVAHSPRLDGTLNDPEWQQAKPITDFRQREPHEGELATEKMEVHILYTRNAVYFGIHCYDSAPSGIVATELRRDVSQDLDDHFDILINSNHDRRGAYVFEINPLGTQSDGSFTPHFGHAGAPINTVALHGTDEIRPGSRVTAPLVSPQSKDL